MTPTPPSEGPEKMKNATELAERWLNPQADDTAIYADDEKTNLVRFLEYVQRDAIASVTRGPEVGEGWSRADLEALKENLVTAHISAFLNGDTQTKEQNLNDGDTIRRTCVSAAQLVADLLENPAPISSAPAAHGLGEVGLAEVAGKIIMDAATESALKTLRELAYTHEKRCPSNYPVAPGMPRNACHCHVIRSINALTVIEQQLAHLRRVMEGEKS